MPFPASNPGMTVIIVCQMGKFQMPIWPMTPWGTYWMVALVSTQLASSGKLLVPEPRVLFDVVLHPVQGTAALAKNGVAGKSAFPVHQVGDDFLLPDQDGPEPPDAFRPIFPGGPRKPFPLA